MINEKDAIEFQKLYEKETGEKISFELSFEIAENVVELFRLIYKPIRKGSEVCTKNDSTT